MSIFLDPADVALLTGKKNKSGQIEFLRDKGILFYTNATGHAVVPKSAIEGNLHQSNQIEKTWIPNVLKHG